MCLFTHWVEDVHLASMTLFVCSGSKHNACLEQVEERKRLHQELMEKLKHQGGNDGSQVRIPALVAVWH